MVGNAGNTAGRTKCSPSREFAQQLLAAPNDGSALAQGNFALPGGHQFKAMEKLMSSDRIEKMVLLPAPRERVWQAISDARQFGQWFGVAFDGPFVAGARLTGRIRPTTVDAEVARLQQPYVDLAFECQVERIEPPRYLSFRWHPYAVQPQVDYSGEPTTQVSFELEEAPGGTRLTIVEAGFDQLPEARRDEAHAANEGGWGMQLQLIGKYLARDA